ncbi:hypothetical protein HCU64_24900 [Methylobacterium sp. C25]|uniref:hypothetical protein n=1 Tax=Methylobacterium sp. C25 TaxID=2721622 RepID=UPI001F3A7270|nr:hypothetical protein [Methylobacterium sp. C25]MCE4226979.1 hypothetical protein [Methylobacterium sp. C25]
MKYHMEICKIGESGAKLGVVCHFSSSTVEEAIDVARSKISDAAAFKSVLNVEIFDSEKRLIMSYTSPRSAENLILQ